MLMDAGRTAMLDSDVSVIGDGEVGGLLDSLNLTLKLICCSTVSQCPCQLF